MCAAQQYVNYLGPTRRNLTNSPVTTSGTASISYSLLGCLSLAKYLTRPKPKEKGTAPAKRDRESDSEFEMKLNKGSGALKKTRSSKQTVIPKRRSPRAKLAATQAPGQSSFGSTESDGARIIHQISVRLSRLTEEHDRALERLAIRGIDDRDRKIQDLSAELQNLKAEYEAVFQATWGPELQAACGEADQIALNYGLTNIKDIDAFSDDDKKHVIASLEGYLVQKDYDQITARLPRAARVGAPEVFLTMFIVKDMNDRAEQEQERFAELYEHWRVTTCRLANVYDVKSRGEHYIFGESTAEYREKLTRRMVSDILHTRTTQLLLKEPKKIQPGDDVYDQLLKLYKRAAQSAINMSFWEVEPEIYLLDRLSPTFHDRSDRVRVAVQHMISKKDRRLDGKPLLRLTVPALHVRAVPRGYPAFDKIIGVDDWKLKAHVLVEDSEQLQLENKGVE
ncbi:hypothetical protein BDV19DRAFT_386918 [Aspergillus venezuelensis]